jgi:hypothetical protein
LRTTLPAYSASSSWPAPGISLVTFAILFGIGLVSGGAVAVAVGLQLRRLDPRRLDHDGGPAVARVPHAWSRGARAPGERAQR